VIVLVVMPMISVGTGGRGKVFVADMVTVVVLCEGPDAVDDHGLFHGQGCDWVHCEFGAPPGGLINVIVVVDML